MKKKIIAILASVFVVIVTIYFIVTGKKNKEIKTALNNPEYDDIDKAATILKPTATASFFNSLVKGSPIAKSDKKTDKWAIMVVYSAEISEKIKSNAYFMKFMSSRDKPFPDSNASITFDTHYFQYDSYSLCDESISEILAEFNYKGYSFSRLENFNENDKTYWSPFHNTAYLFPVKLSDLSIMKNATSSKDHLQYIKNYIFHKANLVNYYFGNFAFTKLKINGMIVNAEATYNSNDNVLISKPSLMKIRDYVIALQRGKATPTKPVQL